MFRPLLTRLIFGMGALLIAAEATSTALAGVRKTTVFVSGQEGYNVYRIPTMVRAANGDLLAFAEARSGGDASEIDIVLKRSHDAGRTWGPLELVKDNADFARFFDPQRLPEITVGNQSPVVDLRDPAQPGRIWMPFTLENDRVFVTHSDDHGRTWSEHVEITSTVKDATWGWYATGPVHGIQLTRGAHAGRLIVPSDHRVAGTNSWGAHVIYSDDHGLSWRLGAVDTRFGSEPVHPNENAAVELVDGRIYFNARNQSSSSPVTRSIAYSDDGGTSYSPAFALDPQFTTPVVQNSVLRFRATDEGDAENVLIHSGPGVANSRADLTLRVSLDEGTTWSQATKIHSGPSAYSDLVKLNDSEIGVLYEAGDALYEQIVFGQVAYDELDPAPFNGVHGDVNQDGALDARDVEAFVAVWDPLGGEYFLRGADSYTHGDLDFDGDQDVYDAALLRSIVLNAGVSPARLATLAGVVPEPATAALAIAACGCFRRRPAPVRADRSRAAAAGPGDVVSDAHDLPRGSESCLGTQLIDERN